MGKPVPVLHPNWNDLTVGSRTSDTIVAPILSKPTCVLLSRSAKCPFILDSGASHHISPECSNFKTLRPIAPHPIQGFNGSSTSAIGIGDIDLCIALGHKLLLKDILFVLLWHVLGLRLRAHAEQL
jgi:hypothetical protein